MKVICTVCARGGSTGLPGKNIRELRGKPLIVHTIEQAQACSLISEVYVSTDDEGIAAVAKNAGAVVPFTRPPELATKLAPKIPVIQHLVNWVVEQGSYDESDLVVDLDPTSPLREVGDIEQCIDLMDEHTDVVITGYEADKSPYFNMVEKKEDGNMGLVKPPSGVVVARQQSPAVYAMNASIYVWKLSTLAKGLWDGKVKLYEMPRERSIDIDSSLDFKIVELLMKEAGN